MAPLTQLFKPGSYPLTPSLSIILASNPLAVLIFFQNISSLHFHFHCHHPLQATIISNLGCWQLPTYSHFHFGPLEPIFSHWPWSSPSSYNNRNQTCHLSIENPSVTSSHLGWGWMIWPFELYNPNWCHTCPQSFCKTLSSWICQTPHTSGSLHSSSLYPFFLFLI